MSFSLRYIVLFALLNFPLPFLFSQINQFQINHVSTAHGLSNNSITYVFKDSRGFIWIGTTDGLNRYDGNGFVVYKHSPYKPNSISDNFISSIVEDHDGNIWIGTQGGGLNKFNPYTEKFTTFYHEPGNENSIPSDFIFHHNSLLVDDDSLLWIGTDRGLCFYDLRNGTFTRVSIVPGNDMEYKDIRVVYKSRDGTLWIGTNAGLLEFSTIYGLKNIYKFVKPDLNSISNNIITSIIEDVAQKRLWIGTEYGLNVFNTETRQFSTFYSQKGVPGTISDNAITSIIKDDAGFFWIGTKSGGVNRYNPYNNSFEYLKHNPGVINSLTDNYIDNLYYDNTGLLWLCTVNTGINIIDIQEKKFSLIRNNPVDPNSLSYNTIRSIYEDRSGKIWIGTYGGGLNKYDGKSFTRFTHQTDNMNSLSHNIITSMYEDEFGSLWIGTWGGGLNRMDLNTGKIIRNDPNIPEFINEIFDDNFGNIWIGSNSGIYIYDQKEEKIIEFEPEDDINKKLTATSINAIKPDKSGSIWVCTWDGINKIILNSDGKGFDDIIHFKKNLNDLNSLSENRTTTIYEDKEGILWIGTYGGGLNKLVFQKDTASGAIIPGFSFYNQDNGLSGNIVYGILEDDNRNLWISTNNGLSKFDIQNEHFTNFDVNDGLQGNQFYWHAFLKSNSGKMYFGGINGLNFFFPENIDYKRDFPQVAITDLLLFNRPVEVGPGEDGRTILDKSITFTDKIILRRKDYAFSLEFTAITYKAQSKIKYAYKLENFDPDWITTDAGKRFATYSHIRPGTYFFKVKSTNEDGAWNDEFTELEIKVLPAYYETIWAFLIYFIVLVFLLVNFRNQVLSRARYRHQIQLEKIERENLQAYNDMKLQFFTNISHEFKTPLTLILGPLENVLSKNRLEKQVKEQLELMLKGSRRLLRLVNQLLEFRKVETGNMQLKVKLTNVIQIVKDTAYIFKANAKQAKINYTMKIPVNSAMVWCDENIIETIIYNLLSNAFKFTAANGKINLVVNFLDENNQTILPNNNDEKFIQLVISDTGIGIPKERIESIFRRFYQIGSSEQQKRGTGIGLALCKDLVALHHGHINVESEPDVGTTFTVIIPVHKDKFEPSDFYENNQSTEEITNNDRNIDFKHEEIYINEDISAIEFKMPQFKNAPLILIVEDDAELASYTGKMLEENYRVIVAFDGEDGLKKAIEKEPDLIISDIMLPEMNGLELCEKIKNDFRTNHIPVILLTALSATDDKIKGLTNGADSYIAKPFHQQHLLVRVKKLIEQREKLKIHYRKEFFHQTSPNVIQTSEEEFLEKIIGYIGKNLSEPELNVETLSKKAGISSTHLYRKIKSLTGLSPNELIRKTRLNKAAELLSGGRKNVSEVMYDVGFSNHSYFAKCFQEEFGQTPKEFASGNGA